MGSPPASQWLEDLEGAVAETLAIDAVYV